MSTDCDPGIIVPDQNPLRRGEKIQIPEEVYKQALFGPVTYDSYQVIARWMREECAKVVSAHHSHAGVWCSHNKCAVALIEENIRKVGNT